MPQKTWEELTQQTIKRIQQIFAESPGITQDQKLRSYELAARIVADQRFDSPSARWNAFINALHIVVQGGLHSVS